MTATTATILNSIDDIEPEQWDRCADAAGAYNPFVRHKFLRALEASNSVGESTGWKPLHVMVHSDGATVGVVPMYLKSHSQGEYVFDYAWADAWHRAGGDYYPKLQISVPFTPASGPRLLCDQTNPEHQKLLLQACQQVAQQSQVSSLHMTFMTAAQWQLAGEHGLLKRMDQQFHWHNGGYKHFDDFLQELASKKRKNLKRERREALSNDIEIEWATADDLTEDHWDAFYQFYLDTGQRKWGSPYLTRAFFSEVHKTMPEDVLLIMAKRDDRYIAGALNFIGADALFGRNWGCIEDHRFLHFEVCYYQAIDFAISRGLSRVEAGAQGSHKVARGYLPNATYSAHWIADANFRDAVARFVDEERDYVSKDMAYIDEHSPFNASTNIHNLRNNSSS